MGLTTAAVVAALLLAPGAVRCEAAEPAFEQLISKPLDELGIGFRWPRAAATPPSAAVGERLAALDREVHRLVEFWNRSGEDKRLDIARYRLAPLAEERRTLLARTWLAGDERAGRSLEAMLAHFPQRLEQLERQLATLALDPALQGEGALAFLEGQVLPPANERRRIIDALRAAGLPCGASAELTRWLHEIEGRVARYPRFMAFLLKAFSGRAGISFLAGYCLQTVKEILGAQSLFKGPGFDYLHDDCVTSISRLRKAGLLKTGLTREELEAYARKGPLVALMGARIGEHGHVGFVVEHEGEVKFFSNSTGRRRIEPLAERFAYIDGVLPLR